jgi:hypothetical protein
MPPIEDWLSFLHAKKFDADWAGLGLNDEDLARLQNALIADPAAGDVIAGTGGLRKLRFARTGEGKSGSLRVCYALIPEYGLILLMMVYGKSATPNLTPADKRVIKKRLDHIKARLDARRQE